MIDFFKTKDLAEFYNSWIRGTKNNQKTGTYSLDMRANKRYRPYVIEFSSYLLVVELLASTDITITKLLYLFHCEFDASLTFGILRKDSSFGTIRLCATLFRSHRSFT